MPESLSTWMSSRRTFPCFNTTDETIPPYAIMLLRRPDKFKETKAAKNTDEVNTFVCQHMRGGQIVWDVTKPNELSVSRQEAADFVFNGPVPIEPLGYGVCSQDWPCQVLHNGNGDRLRNGETCGPVKDRWYVLNSGSAFTCKSHDIGFPAGYTEMHTVWVDRSTRHTLAARGRYPATALNLDADEYFTWGVATLGLNVEIADTNWIKVKRDGLYLISFHGKLTSSDAARGDALAITLVKKPADDADGNAQDPEDTPYVVGRDQDIEKACTGGTTSAADIQTTRENVSFVGYESLSSGDSLSLKNTGSKKITVSNGMLTIMHMGNKIEEDTATDGGGFDTNQS